MKEISAAVFKAQCLTLMEDVRSTKCPLIITKRGKPVAKLVPIEEQTDDFIGVRSDLLDCVVCSDRNGADESLRSPGPDGERNPERIEGPQPGPIAPRQRRRRPGAGDCEEGTREVLRAVLLGQAPQSTGVG